jgi:transketolase
VVKNKLLKKIINSVERCKKYRKKILNISQGLAALHIAPAFSCIEICDYIYSNFIKEKKNENLFIMSKGHGSIIQYVILNERKLIPDAHLKNFCKSKGKLGTHPDFGTPGIYASTGSLGHGAGLAVGRAYAKKVLKQKGTIYCLLSDGELQEGSTWEAVMMASNKNLDNLVFFVDNNDFSGLERMSNSHKSFYPVSKKFKAFNWETYSVDGHNYKKINSCFNRKQRKPKVIICKTIKGKGVSYMENTPIWHYRSPNQKEFVQAMKEIDNEK